ncbi:uncharacterized protein LOC124306471 [Neodiprion virginianus]|uniref:uncharacterized protein LOC124306471 n=1 Tax=Neodiprion virginianus TaxID=2961670 RepID=UPI001EE72692|nr:uncharacterized protein LOC124306471 [Neodiprion virginianus]XP_046623187.1 uncharacterized protein LOC124306471 [Neodiprion virginianus]
MRFTTGKEPGDRAELGHDQIPNNLDESMMAATECKEPTDAGCIEDGSMISNLPLLFADGYPTSLEKITLPQLERFITFMVQCSFGHDTAKVIGEPQWWPKEIKFTNPFVRPRKINESWMGNLKKLVFRCYTYHRSEYLLRFCSHLAQHPRDKLEYVDNWDSTTSLFHKSTGKLLVTFRNENMNYDKKIESPRRLLLPRNSGVSGPASKTKQQLQTVVQPVLCDDIYLCDNCDAEFNEFKKMKEHEKLCCEQEQSSGNSRPVTPEVSAGPQMVQNQFLEYFALSSNDSKRLPKKSCAEATTKTEAVRSSRRIRGSVNLARCPTIPFSSPAGIAMAKKSRTMTEVTQQERLERIERYLIAPPLSNGSRPRWLDRITDTSRWIVSHKANRDKPPQDDYVHEYKFNSLRGKPILSIRSQILCVACRKAIVPITLLTPRQIDELKSNLDKYQLPKQRVRQIRGGGPRPAPKSKRRCSFSSSLSAKRKYAGVVNDLIVIDDDELATVTPIARVQETQDSTEPLRSPEVKNLGSSSQHENESLEKNLSRLSIIRTPELRREEERSSTIENIVTVIDLCSSDEEDNSNGVGNTCDENRDPMQSENQNVTPTFLTNFIPRRLRIGPCVYTTDSTSDWLKRISEPCSGLLE